MTLNPLDPESLEFVEALYDDLLPYFNSNLFNVGCDETWELGKGKSKDVCEEKGKGWVYLEYLKKIHERVVERGKKMMFWGDIIIQYPDLVPEIPKDVVVLEWGYEADHPFEERCKKYKESDIPFYVCPGTSSWNSLSGRTRNMKKNLEKAAYTGEKFGAQGYLITDWGDNGHWQYLPASYPGISYGAALCWNRSGNENADIADYLDEFVFKDEKKLMGQLLLDLGNYYLREKEKLHNKTNIFKVLNSRLEGEVENLDRESLDKIESYVGKIKEDLEKTQMRCKDSELIKSEIRNTIRLIEHGANLARMKLSLNEDKRELLEKNLKEIDSIIYHHKKLWLERNRYGRLHNSLEQFKNLKKEYRSLKKKLNS